MRNSLQLFVLSRDRPNFIKKCIESINSLNLANVNLEVIISDNSQTDSIRELFIKKKINLNNIEKFIYKKRNIDYSARDHIELVIQEASAEFCILFHDDDFFQPHYLKTMILNIAREPKAVAIGCNAYLYKKKNNYKKTTSNRIYKKTEFKDKKLFLQQYLLGSGGVVPFPSYIYRTRFIKKIHFNQLSAGKHGDVIFLTELLQFGHIVWLPDILMNYRVHEQNDSAKENINDRLSLMRYMHSKGVNKKSKKMILFKYFCWFNYITQKQLKNYEFKYKNRKKIIYKYFYRQTIKLFFNSFFWKLIIDKFLIR